MLARYAVAHAGSSLRTRRAKGWVTDYFWRTLIGIFGETGFRCAVEGGWEGQLLFRSIRLSGTVA